MRGKSIIVPADYVKKAGFAFFPSRKEYSNCLFSGHSTAYYISNNFALFKYILIEKES